MTTLSATQNWAHEWPELAYTSWSDTCETLHMLTQIVGKLKLALCAPESHWYHVALSVTPRGIASGPIPCGSVVFEIDFDLIGHTIDISATSGAIRSIALTSKPVREYYREIVAALRELGVHCVIDTMPKEVENPIPFDEDTTHASYDRAAIDQYRTLLTNCDRLLREFRAKFCGHSSSVNFFWGSFDLAHTRFSGRVIEQQTDGKITHVEEEFACGFWPGSPKYPKAAFYAYALPAPDGFAKATIQPQPARFDDTLGEFILDYDDVRTAPNPATAILDFFQSSYEATANLGKWDRKNLERLTLEPIP